MPKAAAWQNPWLATWGGVEIICDVGVMGNAIEIARTMFEEYGVYAIIDRQPTASLLSRIWGDSIVELSLSNYAIVKTILKARAYSRNIAYIIAEDSQQQEPVAELEQLLDVSITCIGFSGRKEDQHQVVRQLKDSGYQAAISAAACMVAPCRHMGIPLFLIELDKESLLQAIKSAVAIANFKDMSSRMRSLLDSEDDGILLIDEHGTIQFCNQVLCQMSGAEDSFLLGKPITGISRYSPFFNILSKSKSVFQFKKKLYSITTFPYKDSKLSGRIIKVISLGDYADKGQSSLPAITAHRDDGFRARYYLSDIAGQHPDMLELKRDALSYAVTDSPILIIGESGVGKELFAQSIHNASRWSDGPFVAVNCAALSENLLESELYGYADGAFTGARKGGKIGLFELSEGGTLFLDEISELPLNLQAKLLRSIQEKQIIRVGGTQVIQIHNRIICASNRNLITEVNNRTFRSDLFFRISVLCLPIPPLRERKSDIPLLIERLGRSFTAQDGSSPRFSPEILDALMEYDWPGNVRQLTNFLESIIVTSGTGTIGQEHFQKAFRRFMKVHGQPGKASQASCMIDTTAKNLDQLELEIIRLKYEEFDHNVQATAAALGISRATLWRKLHLQQETQD